MQRIQAGRNLHRFGFVHRLAVGHIHARLLKRRPAVGEAVLDNEVLRRLGVYKRRYIGISRGYNRRHILNAEYLELCANLVRGARRNFVNHTPGEADLFVQVRDKILPRKAVSDPSLGNFHNTCAQLFAVMRAIVHTYHRNRAAACTEPCEQQRRGNTHRVAGIFRTFGNIACNDIQKRTVELAHRVAFFGNRVARKAE